MTISAEPGTIADRTDFFTTDTSLVLERKKTEQKYPRFNHELLFLSISRNGSIAWNHFGGNIQAYVIYK